MTRPRILRLLRIAMAVACLSAYALVIVFWIRSYWWTDSIYCQHLRYISGISSRKGQLTLRESNGTDLALDGKVDWGSREVKAVKIPVPTFDVRITQGSVEVELPYGFAMVVLAALFAITQRGVPHRFSLRTLLIATTIVAVLLGLVGAMR